MSGQFTISELRMICDALNSHEINLRNFSASSRNIGNDSCLDLADTLDEIRKEAIKLRRKVRAIVEKMVETEVPKD